MALITISSVTIPNWQGNLTGVQLRLYNNEGFVAETGTIYPKSVVSNSAIIGTFYQEYACTVSPLSPPTENSTLTIPDIITDSTTDSSNPTATYTAELWDSISGRGIQSIGTFGLVGTSSPILWTSILNVGAITGSSGVTVTNSPTGSGEVLTSTSTDTAAWETPSGGSGGITGTLVTGNYPVATGTDALGDSGIGSVLAYGQPSINFDPTGAGTLYVRANYVNVAAYGVLTLDGGDIFVGSNIDSPVPNFAAFTAGECLLANSAPGSATGLQNSITLFEVGLGAVQLVSSVGGILIDTVGGDVDYRTSNGPITINTGTTLSVQALGSSLIDYGITTINALTMSNADNGGIAITDAGGGGIEITELGIGGIELLDEGTGLSLVETGTGTVTVAAAGTGGINIVDEGGGGVLINSTSNTYPAVLIEAQNTTVAIGPLVQASFLYSTAGTALPHPTSVPAGTEATVSDASSPTYMGAYSGGGGVTCRVITDGTTWYTH